MATNCNWGSGKLARRLPKLPVENRYTTAKRAPTGRFAATRRLVAAERSPRETIMALKTSADPFLPTRFNLKSLRAAAAVCEGCDLYNNATQTVFGEGP